MLSRAQRILRRGRIYVYGKRFTTTVVTPMYCIQCEQTSGGTGCISQGICGKFPETAQMQDLLLYVNNGVSQYLANMDESKLDLNLKEKARAHLNESTFSTLTNVNFSEDAIIDYIEKSIGLRQEIVTAFRAEKPQKQEFELVPNSPCNYNIVDEDNLQQDAQRLAGLYTTREKIGDADCFGLRECAQYGLKGMMAYFDHAESMQLESGMKCYDEKDRDHVYSICYNIMNDLCSTSKDLNFWLGACMKVGETNVKVLELLDRAHNTCFGTPIPTEVSATPVEGKAILMSGHDILDVKRVLYGITARGLDIDVYTHGELLPAHSYPELQKYGALKGHFGKAWQEQYVDFKKFPGPVVLTSNCLMPPRKGYKDRLYTTHAVGYDDIPHLNLGNENDLNDLFNKAVQCAGFNANSIAKLPVEKPYLTGFGHATLLSKADVILDAIKAGALTDIFVIGGCDGSEDNRSYFTDLAAATPDSSLILTLGCGKFRLRDLELGDIGGIPRILDLGQCNDSFSAVVVALKLAEALGTDIHHLPLHFAVSWFEQKAVAVFLSLLHLQVKNIRIGPALPAFLTPDVLQYLSDNLQVKAANLADPKQDLKEMLAETSGEKQ